jgi:hypothetical protein
MKLLAVTWGISVCVCVSYGPDIPRVPGDSVQAVLSCEDSCLGPGSNVECDAADLRQPSGFCISHLLPSDADAAWC